MPGLKNHDSLFDKASLTEASKTLKNGKLYTYLRQNVRRVGQ